MSKLSQEIDRLEAMVARLKAATTPEQQAIQVAEIAAHTDLLTRLTRPSLKLSPQQALANTYVVSSDFWATMAGHLKTNRINTAAGFKQWADAFEREYRARHNVSQMPNSYRSAKSILSRAIKHGVAYADQYGNILGKTMVQKKVDGLLNT